MPAKLKKPEPPPVLRVRDWATNFESHESRKLKRLSWFAMPADQGIQWKHLAAAGPDVYGAFVAVLQVAAAQSGHRRGYLADPDGRPLDGADIAILTGLPADAIDRAIQAGLAPKVALLEWSAPPPLSGESAGTPAESAGTSGKKPGHITGPDRTGPKQDRQDQTQPDRTDTPPPPSTAGANGGHPAPAAGLGLGQEKIERSELSVDIGGLPADAINATSNAWLDANIPADFNLLKVAIAGPGKGATVNHPDVRAIPATYPASKVYIFAAVAELLRKSGKEPGYIIGAIRALEADPAFAGSRCPALTDDEIAQRRERRQHALAAGRQYDTRVSRFK